MFWTEAREEEHPANLVQVLRLGSTRFRLKLDKCTFLLKSFSYLKHVISVEGLHISDMGKVVVDAPNPKTSLSYCHSQV